MPGRGELIGEAYILVRADGSLLKKDLKTTVSKQAALGGEDSGKAYSDAFEKEWKEATARLGADFRRNLARMTSNKDFTAFDRQFKSIDESAKALDKTLRKMGDNDMLSPRQIKRIELAWGEYEEQVRKQIKLDKELADGQMAMRIEMERVAKTWEKVLPKEVEERHRRFISMYTQSYLDRDFRRMAKSGESAIDTSERLVARLGELRDRLDLTDDQFKELTTSTRNWAIEVDKVRTEKIRLKELGGDVDVFSKRVRVLNEDINRFNVRIGRFFGRGARNDFVNLFGALVSLPFRAITSGIGLIAKGAEAGRNALGRFSTAFQAAIASGSRGLPALARGVGAIFGGPQGIVAGIVGLGVALFAFGKVLPAVISSVSLLAGALVALAGAIGVGLSAALLAFIPLLPAAAAGFGLLGKAIYDFSQSKNNGKKVLEELNKELEKTTDKLVPKLRKSFQLITDGADTLLKPLGAAVGRVIDDFNSRLQESRDSGAFKAWGDSIVAISESLGIAFNALFQGLTEFFVPILPYAERLAEWLRRSWETFADWAASAEGRNSIADWMESAWEVGRDLWGVLRGAGEALAKIFQIGSDNAGGSFLDSLNGKLEELNGWLDRPENQRKLGEWFEDAKRIGEDVGDIVLSLGEMVGHLNSEDGRAGAKELFDGLKSLADLASDLASLADTVGALFDMMIAGAEAIQALQSGNIPGFLKALADFDVARVKIEGDTSDYEEKARQVKDDTFPNKDVPVSGRDDAWIGTRDNILRYDFTDKPVPVSGDQSAWLPVKTGIEKWHPPLKKVQVVGPSYSELAAIQDYISRNINPRVRVTVDTVLPNGSRYTGGGITMASGGVVSQPTRALIGEGGFREAVVPLDRPLSMIDQSVRGLAAIAQGKGAYADGGVAGGRSVVVEEGAVQVVTRATNPTLVGRVVLDGIEDALR